MAQHTARKLFVNLAVHDLGRSVEFFTRLGFHFDPAYTDDRATCMILSDEAFVMLLEEGRFQEFTKKRICDSTTHTEALLALSCASRAEVDAMVEKAVDGGGHYAMDPQDHGFMYGWSFHDPDGHHWEVIWMNPDAPK